MAMEQKSRKLYRTRVRDNNSGYNGPWAEAHAPLRMSLEISGAVSFEPIARGLKVGVSYVVGVAGVMSWLRLLRRTKDQQQLAEEKLERADQGDPPPTRRRKWRELEARLQRLREHYIAGRRDLGPVSRKRR
ncbi:unnamed protein product [Boreogadus saida]